MIEFAASAVRPVSPVTTSSRTSAPDPGASGLLSRLASERACADRVCHELLRPLSVIHAYVELIADGIQGPVTAGLAESLATVRSAADKRARDIDLLEGD